MAGLAAALNAPGCIDALRDALASRGADETTLRFDGIDDAILEVAVRAGMPTIARVVGDPESEQATLIAAFAVDGVTSVTALDSGYVNHGPAGLIDGAEPYAVILADGEREALVLARNGDGPSLYYARCGDGWLAASEPVALIRAGVPAAPDVDTVRAFVDSGVCDDTERTFFADISRVLPGEAVTLIRDGRAESVQTPFPQREDSVVGALETALAGERVGVLLGPGLPGAVLLGTALSRPDALRPLPVHTVAFPGSHGPAAHTPAVLVSLPYGALRQQPHEFDLAALDLDGFLTDLGEPVGDLELYLLWAVGRTLGEDVDTLVDSAFGSSAGLARLRDRVAARYGVTVCSPLRDVGPTDRGYESIVEFSLPAVAARHAAGDSAAPVTAEDLVLAIPRDVAAALARSRPWLDRAAGIEGLRRLTAGEPADAEPLWRVYLVERWLAVLPSATDSTSDSGRFGTGHCGRSAQGLRGTGISGGLSGSGVSGTGSGTRYWTGSGAGRAGRDPMRPDDVVVAGQAWSRLRIQTQAFTPGDGVAGKAAWYVSNALTELARDRSTRDALGGPWVAVLSAKAVAVGQRRVCPLWDIKSSRSARLLSRLARRNLPRLGDAWTMQVAFNEGGAVRVALAVLVSLFWAAGGERVLPAPAANLFPPRDGAVSPADSAVIRAPFHPDGVAGDFLDALRYGAPVPLVASLAGCAVLSADEGGSRLLGFAAGPRADAVPDLEAVIALLCVDNPAGQLDDRTPVVLAYQAPRRPTVDDHDDAPGFPPHNADRSAAPTAGRPEPARSETTPAP